LLGLFRQRAEAINEFCREAFPTLLCIDISKPTIKPQSDAQVLDIVFRYQNGDTQIDLRGPVISDLLVLTTFSGLQGIHGVFQHGLVKLDPYFADMSRLLVSQEVTRAPHVEIVTCELEPGTETI
jgi:hypothetical protein